MQKKNLLIKIVAGLASLMSLLSSIEAQTVLSGDHVIEGNLEVGTTADPGGMTIVGHSGTNSLPGIRATADNGVIFEGTFGEGATPLPTDGRAYMIFHPGKAAFKIGAESDVVGTVGNYSVAMAGAEASGEYSTALSGCWADGDYSVAMSGGQTEFEKWTTAMSVGYATGKYATAMSAGIAAASSSTAMSGGLSYGEYSVAGGKYVFAASYRCATFGSYNRLDNNESPNTWVETDPIFVVGNGTGNYPSDPTEKAFRNALVIRKNGNFEMNGNVEMMAKVKMPRQGDILMGEFGEAEP